jgi:hypothetical protein
MCLNEMYDKVHIGKHLFGTHQLLVWADDVKLLGDNIDTRKKNINFN